MLDAILLYDNKSSGSSLRCSEVRTLCVVPRVQPHDLPKDRFSFFVVLSKAAI